MGLIQLLTASVLGIVDVGDCEAVAFICGTPLQGLVEGLPKEISASAVVDLVTGGGRTIVALLTINYEILQGNGLVAVIRTVLILASGIVIFLMLWRMALSVLARFVPGLGGF